MTDDLSAQIRAYTRAQLETTSEEPLDVDRFFRIPRRRRRRSRFVALAGVLVVVLVTVVAFVRSDESGPSAPRVTTPARSAQAPTTWSQVGTPGEMQAAAMAVSKRGFVVGGDRMAYSRNGRRWKAASIYHFGRAADIIATPSGFLAVGVSDDRHAAIWTSSDGSHWSASDDRSLVPSTPLMPAGVSTPYGSADAVARTPLGYVVVGAVSDGQLVDGTPAGAPWKAAVWTSTDGTSWSSRASDTWTNGTSLVSVTSIGRDVYVEGTDNGTSTVWHSNDLVTWAPVASLPATSINEIAAFDGHLIAVGTTAAPDGNHRLPTIWRAETPSTWTTVYQGPVATVNDLTTVVSNGTYVLALGGTGPFELLPDTLMLYSTDGTNWRPTTTQSCSPSDSCLQPAIAYGYPTTATTDGVRFYAGFASIASPHTGDSFGVRRRNLTVYRSPSTQHLDPSARALWQPDPSNSIRPTSRSFTANVTRIACSGGQTGPVRDPAIRYGRTTITITFTVGPLPPGGYTCPGGTPTPYRVHLSEPIGRRKLVDGACADNPDLAALSTCLPTARRWPVPSTTFG